MTYTSLVLRLWTMLHTVCHRKLCLFLASFQHHQTIHCSVHCMEYTGISNDLDCFDLFSSMYGSSPLSKQPPFWGGEDGFTWKSDVSAQCSSVAEWGPALLCFRVTLCGPTFSWILGTAQLCLTQTWAGLRRGLNMSTSQLEYSVSQHWQRTRWVMTPQLFTYMSHVSATVLKLNHG